MVFTVVKLTPPIEMLFAQFDKTPLGVATPESGAQANRYKLGFFVPSI